MASIGFEWSCAVVPGLSAGDTHGTLTARTLGGVLVSAFDSLRIVPAR